MSAPSSLKGYSSVLSILSLSGLTLGASQPVFAETVQVAQGFNSASQYNYLFVNSNTGNDGADGTERSPLKTITRALQIVQPNTIILLAPGTYSAQSGEAFPLQMRPETTIKGEPSDRGQNTIIQGSGVFLSRTFARQNVTIVGANRAGLTGVTVSNPNAQGYGLWTESTSPVVSDNTFTGSGHDGASIVGSSAPVLRNNYFYQNGANGITIYGTSRPELQENIFEKTGFGINVAQDAAPRITGNRITQNQDGIVVQGKAQPLLRNNVIDGNVRDGVVTIAQARPNLGTSTDPGNNTFTNNGQFDLNAQKSIQTISAVGNQTTSTKTIGRLDFSGTSTTVAAVPLNTAASIGFGQPLPTVAPTQFQPNRSPVSSQYSSNRPSAPSVIMPSVSHPSNGSMAIALAPSSFRRAQPIAQPKPPQSLVVPTEIPVPVPASFTTLVNRSNRADVVLSRTPQPLGFNQPQGFSGAINIPVPPPESRSTFYRATASRSVPSRAVPSRATSYRAVPSRSVSVRSTPKKPTANLPAYHRTSVSKGALPVPNGAIPIGRTRGTSVNIWRGNSTSSNSSSAPKNGNLAFGLRYRIVVHASSGSEQAQVQAVVPGAFSVFGNRPNVMQAGLFSDRAKAEELLQTLVSQGLRASIEQLQ